MAGKVKPIPDGYHAITPYIVVSAAAKAIDFYAKAFGAKELFRIGGPNDSVGHAELQFGDSIIMLADEFPSMGAKGPKAYGGSPVSLMLYVEDVDKVVDTAVKAGGKIVRPLENKFYGDRAAQIEDPFGHTWTVATHVEDVPPDEIERRAAALHG